MPMTISVPTASFVFTAIIDSFRPIIFESKKTGVESFEKNMVRFYAIIIYLSLLQSLGITIFSELLVKILYGVEYLPAVNPLRIIVWFSTFSYLGAVRNVWILAENQQKYLWVINLSGDIANILLNFALIPLLGVVGAAIASLVTQIFTNVIIGIIIKPIRRNNYLMLKGCNPKILLDFFKK